MTYQTEFPGFADMPHDIPAALVDSSWHNDTCPSFTVWEDVESPLFQFCKLWVNYADPKSREFDGSSRFELTLFEEDGRVEPVNLFMSDDWQAMRKQVEFYRDNLSDILKLARYFSALIRAEYSRDEFAEVIRLNRTPEYIGACATHDFRDANAYMYGAFAALYFREIDFESDKDNALTNAAWDIARATGFAGFSA